ncbi:MAG TPA: hypothetical protein VF546_23900 [Pyrinomonadaceae bacterium]|jgi:hypothetical protein
MLRLFAFGKLPRRHAIRLFAVIMLATVLTAVVLQHSRAVRSQTSASKSAPRATATPTIPQCMAATPQTIYAPTIDMPEAAGARIVFNSRTETVTEVRPTFYTAAGEPVAGAAIYLQPAEIRTVDMAVLLPKHRRGRERWGGIALRYTGKAYDVWAQLTLLGAERGGSSDVTFSVLNGLGSPVQEAVWWQPAAGRSVLALGNSTDTPISTELSYADNAPQLIEIAPHATEYVRLRARGALTLREQLEGQPASVRLVTQAPPAVSRRWGWSRPRTADSSAASASTTRAASFSRICLPRACGCAAIARVSCLRTRRTRRSKRVRAFAPPPARKECRSSWLRSRSRPARWSSWI